MQKEIGQGLPESLRDLYKQNDGQDRFKTTCGVFFGLVFSSLSQMTVDWRNWRDIAKSSYSDLDIDFREFGTIFPSRTIQNFYAYPGWLPFSRDGGGNHLGIDLQPDIEGKVGQIINFGRDEEHRRVIAPSIEGFIEWILAQYSSGNYRIATLDMDGQKRRRIQILEPNREVFLDAIPILFPKQESE